MLLVAAGRREMGSQLAEVLITELSPLGSSTDLLQQ